MLPASVVTVQREKIKVEKKVVEKVVFIGKDVSVTCLSGDEDAEILFGGAKHVASIKKGIAKITI
ncbi:MAG: hypothetical protein J7K04_14665 [Spirochaetales bacterium]|nr:hypothetical protein [Spirochaetales bacterium]